MKTRYSVKWMLVGTLLSWGLTACSFGGDEEEAAEVTTEEGEVAEGEAAEVPEGENMAVEGENANFANANGAEMENVEGGDVGAEGNFANSEIPPELLNSDMANAGAEGINENLAADNSMATDMGNPMMDPAANTMPMDNSTMDPAAMAPPVDPAAAPMAAPMAPSGGMRVYYVSVDGGSIRNAPNASGQTVGTVSKGDPLLVMIEGDWANVANRGYIEVANLSQAPVGRTLAPKAWQ